MKTVYSFAVFVQPGCEKRWQYKEPISLCIENKISNWKRRWQQRDKIITGLLVFSLSSRRLGQVQDDLGSEEVGYMLLASSSRKNTTGEIWCKAE